ncbi:MAG: 4-oxalocrotonate tautomerase family protein [Polyangia bacterium]|jgi:4-oxalocrotonate tautomerase|nr:4-oxalocrotonate tautomerase family protein [Polyangia bacterium]
MPIVNLKVLGTLTEDQKRELAARFTKDLEEVAGKPPEYTYVVIEEVPETNWAHRGRLLCD